MKVTSNKKVSILLFLIYCIFFIGYARGGVLDVKVEEDSVNNAKSGNVSTDYFNSLPGFGFEEGREKREEQLSIKTGLLNSVNTPLAISPLSREIDYSMLWKVGLVVGGGWTALHFVKQNAWWKKNATNFHIYYDWDYALWLDKVGHFYGTTILAHSFRSAFEACNFEQEEIVWYGSVMALAFQTYVEIEDGFSPDWGFSPPDMYANILGATFPVLQYYEPFFNNFQFKFSYYPKWAINPHPADGRRRILIDDYEGQKYWLSFNVKNLLPNSVSRYWFSWLNIAVGVGGKNINGWGGGQKDIFIALDLNTDELPIYGSFQTFIKRSLSFIKLPMPGIRITDKLILIGLCY